LAEEAAKNPKQQQCYSRKLFDEESKYNLTKEEIASLSGNLFGAGSDTSSSTLITFVLACCAFPEVLPKAWEELDRVVGHHRSPTFEDEPNLPYVKAFVKEVFRWRSVAIIGGQPHAPTQDDYYKVCFPHQSNPVTNMITRVGTFLEALGFRETSGRSITTNVNFPTRIASIPSDSSKAVSTTGRFPASVDI
jgi:hypothetical protein